MRGTSLKNMRKATKGPSLMIKHRYPTTSSSDSWSCSNREGDQEWSKL